MPPPDSIFRLVENFSNHLDHYKSSGYNETEVRREFLDPFFKALGWDIDNEQGYADAYKDVVHEDSIKIGVSTKAPDYSFRIGGQRKFFLEAKKPSVDITTDIAPAYQLRRYGWSAKLPLSILSDFEDFAVYDCRVRPVKSDKASKARIINYTFEQYADKWDEIASIFSREAILKGSFDKYAESTRKKHGTAEVDEAFLKEIEHWREMLAHNFALRNPALSVRDLNFAVQKTIDRLIFLRICEDRGSEDYGRLQELQEGKHTYHKLLELFRLADDRYNSGLFQFSEEKNRPLPDTLTPSLALDDKVLREILKNLYYPDSPYEFSVLPADILGHVYEQFLGKTIRLTAAHRAKIEEKPEVRKAGGVYYTPKYIVDYIVQNTLGKLLNGDDYETAKPIPVSRAESVKILDPACGSGSFLIVAYQYLLDWHRDQYTLNPDSGERDQGKIRRHAGGKNPKLYQAPGGEYRLTTSERKRILLNNIHGVDIDSQAVEVTKLSLLLKVLEGETLQTRQRDWLAERERILPDLGQNIQCGNSLIGPDFYEQPNLPQLDEETEFRINVFDWKNAFPDIFNRGGFDCVIGNPPWVSLSGKFGNDLLSPLESDYLIIKLCGNTYMPNLYEYFVTRGAKLTRENGFFSFIVPDRLGFNQQFTSLRERLLTDFRIHELAYRAPFPGVTVDTLIFNLERSKSQSEWRCTIGNFGSKFSKINQGDLLLSRNCRFESGSRTAISKLMSLLPSKPRVNQLTTVCQSTSGVGGKSALITKQRITNEQQPILKGSSISTYSHRSTFWFEFKKENITGRTTNPAKLGAVPKVLLRKTGDKLIATFDESGIFPEQSLYFLFDFVEHCEAKFVLGLLNSHLITTYYAEKLLTNRASIAQVKKVDLDTLPLWIPDFTNQEDVAKHDRMVELVNIMLDLHKRKAAEKNPETLRFLERKISTTDRQIDGLVYALYDLTEEEITLVEQSN